MRLPAGIWRRAILGTGAATLLLCSIGYAAFALMTLGAPPPPSFGRMVSPAFDAALDGQWYGRGCRSFEVLGGWLFPPPNGAIGHTGGSLVQISEPADLTNLELGGRTTVRLEWAGNQIPFTVEWSPGLLTIEHASEVVLTLRRSKLGACAAR